jgi:RNA polymerase sigma factor (sigma-70 family)
MGPARSHRQEASYAAPPVAAVRLAPAPPPAVPDHAALWALVVPFRDRLVALARARGLSSHDAQDVAHHVLCRAVERGSLDPDRVEAYLVRAATTRCQDLLLAARRQEELLARSHGDDRLAGRVDEAVCDRAHLTWLLGKLPAREQKVVLLSVSGETVTGIAAATGLSYPTVDRLLSRARKEMRRLAGLAGVTALALWRQRKLAATPVATTAVAVAGVTVLTLHASEPPAGVPLARPAARVTVRAEPPEEAAKVVRVRATVTRPVVAPPAGSAQVAPVARDVAEVSAPKVTAPTTIAVRREHRNAVAEVQACVREGVRVRTGVRTEISCGETRSASVGL